VAVSRRLLLVFVVAVSLIVPQVGKPAEASPAEQACDFTLGFRTLRDMIAAQYGDIVGACRENEWHNEFNGDGLQQTAGGLMVWRKADNWTAFTNGATTWLNGPFGLATRPNAGPLFSWENPAPPGPPGPPPPPPPGPPAPGATATPTPPPSTPGKPNVQLRLEDDRVVKGESFTLRIEARDDGGSGIAAIWWWATDTDDDELRDTHIEDCSGVSPCRKTWQVETEDTGDITFHAKSRNGQGVESDEVSLEIRVREPTATPTATATATRTPTP
jgi:hypothetical protein